MDALDLHVEHRAWIDPDPELFRDLSREPLLVPPADGDEALAEEGILRHRLNPG